MPLSDEHERLIARYRQSGVLLDANVTLLYCVGNFDVRLVRRFGRRLSTYEVEHYRLLDNLLRRFERRWTTANVWTEVCHLSADLKNIMSQERLRSYFLGLSRIAEGWIEKLVSSHCILGRHRVESYGLTDCGLVAFAKRAHRLLLTADAPLSHFASNYGAPVLNFNNLLFRN